MKKIVLLIILSIFIITGCSFSKNSNDNIIKLNSKTYISQLEKITIKGTNDYFMITEKRSFDSVKDNIPDATTVSWSISVPYIININNIDYSGNCVLGDYEECNDDNPKYDIKISNLDKKNDNYYAEVLISKK